MISRQAKTLQNRFYDELIASGCDNDFANLCTCIDIEGHTFLEVRQAYMMAVCDAAKAHIENCYDTPRNDENEQLRNAGRPLDVTKYIDWMNAELKGEIQSI